jgi:heterodisulfide reductase subunit B
MGSIDRIDLSYFPGCSLATTAKESNESLMKVCEKLGLNLIELEDWNCCGSSSAHSLDKSLAFSLPARNLSLAPSNRPLLVMCPTCLHRLQLAHRVISENPEARLQEEARWGRPIDPNLKIVHFFEVLSGIEPSRLEAPLVRPLGGLKVVPYYGCMLARPPSLRKERNYHGLIEKILSGLGAESLPWSFSARCCGTFLSAARPDIATPLVNEIIGGAVRAGAECIVTACAMCQLNLEIRCTLEERIPTLHFSEILALAFGAEGTRGWFKRHLVDPMPLLKGKRLIE